MTHRQRCAIPVSDAPAWEALGWRIVGEAAMGQRCEGPAVLIEWQGEGEPRIPEGRR